MVEPIHKKKKNRNGHQYYSVKPSYWGKHLQEKSKNKIHYVIKLVQNDTQVLPLLEFLTPHCMVTILTI